MASQAEPAAKMLQIADLQQLVAGCACKGLCPSIMASDM
jgi:hypothetical protein